MAVATKNQKECGFSGSQVCSAEGVVVDSSSRLTGGCRSSCQLHMRMMICHSHVLLCIRCAEAFAAAGRHDAAVRLLVKGKQVERALDLLLANEVPLTEELAEALTPAKTAENADQRNAVLLRLAQVRSTFSTCCAQCPA
jgi:hypothetical protein